tara:strand:- start:877 stop:1005 length:129 start_codon:yes stop_codon:yes gene_type:complete
MIKIIKENNNETNIRPIALGSFSNLKLMYANPAESTISIEKR